MSAVQFLCLNLIWSGEANRMQNYKLNLNWRKLNTMERNPYATIFVLLQSLVAANNSFLCYLLYFWSSLTSSGCGCLKFHFVKTKKNLNFEICTSLSRSVWHSNVNPFNDGLQAASFQRIIAPKSLLFIAIIFKKVHF